MKFILLLLLALSECISARGEPIQPLLHPAAVDSLQRLLRQSQPDTSRVNLLLLLSRDLIDRNDELSTPLANAYSYSKQAEQLSDKLHFVSGKIQSLQALGRICCANGDNDAGWALLQSSLRLSDQLGNKQLSALAWYYLGEIYNRTADHLPGKIACYRKAMQLYQQSGDQPKAAYLLKTIADVHLWQGNSALALQELAQVIALYRAARVRKLHYTYDLMLSANTQIGNHRAALQDGFAAIESAKATHDTVDLGVFYLNVGRVYEELHQLPEALDYYIKGFSKKGNKYTFSAAGKIAKVLIRQKKPQQALAFYRAALNAEPTIDISKNHNALRNLAECYAAVQAYPTAERYYAELVALLEKGANDDVKLACYTSVGKFYLLTKQYAKARLYMEKALSLSPAVGSLMRTADIQLLLFKVDSSQANLSAAITHYQAYKVLNDSVFNANESKQIASLQIQYDTKKKEQNIVLLTKQNQLQQASLRQEKLLRNALLGGAVLLSLLLVVSYNRYRAKQRSTALLETKQQEINQQNHALAAVLVEKDGLLEEKEWMLKEIHHRVKNNLQIISSLLSRQSHYLRDAPALSAIRESQNRVQAMALIHQKLYQSNSLARVNMQDYTHEIVARLIDSFDGRPAIGQQVDATGVDLEVALATPVGLIINEAVTNALKHAFPHQRAGTIAVGLRQLAGGNYELTIADDGVGLPVGYDIQASRSLGLTIIQGLSKQLHGLLTIVEAGGVHLRLQFAAHQTNQPNSVGV